ncbi:MAG: tyrosine-type recombinase/integrase [Thermoleophilaceae bacterium]|nr:tyrosine-type recombinase/integrase [Thermoleophilaceae bacterium]
MFDTLFSYSAVRQRHEAGPLAAERAACLRALAARGAAHGTLLRWARYTLCVAREIERWPPGHSFAAEEIAAMASDWAAGRTAAGRAKSPRWPQESFGPIAAEFLGTIGRRRPVPVPAEPYHDQLEDFVSAQREGRWQSEATCATRRWQVRRFLLFLEQQGVALGDVEATHLDSFFGQMAQRWCRVSLRTSATALRGWLAHCERRGWVRPGLAAAILLPRIYRHEGLPLGPTWADVGRMLGETAGEQPVQLRDQAILRLLSVYGLRSGEVRRLRLDDLDWQREQIHIVRSKSGRHETLPLEASVGNAIARYLRHGRPESRSRIVFLTARAPYRSLSPGGLYGVVRRRLSGHELPKKGRGPHGLRHACARHLMESGRSFKEVGDHLGHRSPDATRIYAKVDLPSLRRVAFDDLGGLT